MRSRAPADRRPRVRSACRPGGGLAAAASRPRVHLGMYARHQPRGRWQRPDLRYVEPVETAGNPLRPPALAGSATSTRGCSTPSSALRSRLRARRAVRATRREARLPRRPTRSRCCLSLGCSLPFYFRRRAPVRSARRQHVLARRRSRSCQYPANVQSQMLVVVAYTVGACGRRSKRAHRPGSGRCGVARRRDHRHPRRERRQPRALRRVSTRRRTSFGSTHAQPPALHRAARGSAPPTSNASATRRRSARSPTSGCASRRSCTTSSRTRWASSRCRPASART